MNNILTYNLKQLKFSLVSLQNRRYHYPRNCRHHRRHRRRRLALYSSSRSLNLLLKEYNEWAETWFPIIFAVRGTIVEILV